ncbi:DUF726 domain-containing protein [uncultured Propionibacterium sp.]|uniref:DUF726 domain-containing protein n=1 Tax=uncultured Propionibacterium sp. TaxID=218066 RepID=UPI00292DFD40|nr:DUF726 domain-containing protein [uncultured Propionibacterium sp.]
MSSGDSSPRFRYAPNGADGAEGTISLRNGERLVVRWPGAGHDADESIFSGTERLVQNPSFRARLLDCVICTKMQRLAAAGGAGDEAEPVDAEPAPEGFDENLWELLQPKPETLDEKLKRLRRETEEAEKALIRLANIHGYGLQEDGEHDRDGWCSACLARTHHRAMAVPGPWRDAWVCAECGVITARCTVPRCPNMAIRGFGPSGVLDGNFPVCAEHSHEIPSFESRDMRIDDLEYWEDLFEYERFDAIKATRRSSLVLAAAAAAFPLTYAAAPAIGGAVGAVVGGYSGAAATSYGLALLGGGPLAAGGLGMAGGQLVIAIAGGGVGSTFGLRAGTAYLGGDKSFGIECVRDGDGPAVVYSTGFLTESDESWESWGRLIDTAYPGNPVYRVRWGAKELKNFGALVTGAGVKTLAGQGVRRLASHAAKAAPGLLPLNVMAGATGVLTNPWHTAVNRAKLAGVTLAEILSRTNNESGFILLGHSLGAAAMASAVQELGASGEPSPVVVAHLLGGAFPASSDCAELSRGVRQRVYNYYSTNDPVLSKLYRAASFGVRAAGSAGLDPKPEDKVVNVDVSEQVTGHSDYVSVVHLVH